MIKAKILIFTTALLFAQFATAQKYENYTCKIKGTEHSYTMYFPQNIKPNAPLVFVLHGYGSTNNPQKYDMSSAANKHGFAVCYPLGLKDTRGKYCWNVGYPSQKGMKNNDIDVLCKMAKIIQKKFNLSTINTFCCGMSNGGEMCYLLAYSKQNTFAAVAPVSGLTMLWMYQKFNSPTPIPLFEIHGTEDRTSEWNGDLTGKGGWGQYMPVPIAVNFWVAQNRCTNEIVDTLPIKNKENGHLVISHKFTGGINGNEVWLYQIVGGKHSWAKKDIDTDEEIWSFFSKYVKQNM